jgi:hypothetical protein
MAKLEVQRYATPDKTFFVRPNKMRQATGSVDTEAVAFSRGADTSWTAEEITGGLDS